MLNRANVILLATGLASFVLLGLSMSILGPILPVLAARFDYDVATASWLLSLFWAGCLFGVITVYFKGSHLGPRFGLALSAVGSALIATMVNWPIVLFGSAVFGMGYGVLAAVYNPRLLAVFGPRGPMVLSMINATFTLGAIAAPQIFLLLESKASTAFLFLAAFAVVIFLAAGPAARAGVEDRTTTTPTRVDWPTLALVVFGIGMESSLVGLGPAALTIAGQDVEQAARLLSLFFITYLISRVSLIFLADRLPAFPTYCVAMAVTAGICAGAVKGDVAFWFPLLGFPAGFYFFSGFMTGIARMGANERVSAILLAAGLLGSILQPTLIGQVLDVLGPKGFFEIAFGISAGMTLFSLLLAPRMRRG